ncbi:MAG: hypothetical protein ACI9DC_004206 [Gammaproteobacteria bacterium]|jgi:hypothetical protein
MDDNFSDFHDAIPIPWELNTTIDAPFYPRITKDNWSAWRREIRKHKEEAPPRD